MKTAVIYKSRTGFAQKYANLIAEQLNADVFSAKSIHVEKLFTYDTIIFGGGLYVNGIYGLRTITNNLNILKDKHLVVFATGATKASKRNIEYIMNSNFSKRQLMQIKFFYLQSGFDVDKLSLIDKFFLQLIKMKLWVKKEKSDGEHELITLYKKNLDVTSKENTLPIVKYVKNLE